jgi:hypothetical protein
VTGAQCTKLKVRLAPNSLPMAWRPKEHCKCLLRNILSAIGPRLEHKRAEANGGTAGRRLMG